MQQEENQITIIVSGPSLSGKTAIAALIADTLIHAGKFTDVRLAYPEESPQDIKAKEMALLDGAMNHLLNNPVVIAETGKLSDIENIRGGFKGYYRTLGGERWYKWGAAPVSGYTFAADVSMKREGAFDKVRSVSDSTPVSETFDLVRTGDGTTYRPDFYRNTKVIDHAMDLLLEPHEETRTERVELHIAVPTGCENIDAYVADAINEILRPEARPQVKGSSLVDYKLIRQS